MGTGKYSPLCPHAHEEGWEAYRFNCYGEKPTEWSKELADSGMVYDEKTMYDNYDDEGFDSYGYSAFDPDGDYVGVGNGIDRYGYSEDDYLMDSINGGDLYYGGGHELMTEFVRNRD